MSDLKINRQFISEKILNVRKYICKNITEEMTIKQAYEKLNDDDISYSSFYNQCKSLITLGYLKECGYSIVGKTHSLKIVSINHDYVYEFHNRSGVNQEKQTDLGEPRLVKLTNEKYWTIEKKKSGRVQASGSSLSMVIATGNY